MVQRQGQVRHAGVAGDQGEEPTQTQRRLASCNLATAPGICRFAQEAMKATILGEITPGRANSTYSGARVAMKAHDIQERGGGRSAPAVVLAECADDDTSPEPSAKDLAREERRQELLARQAELAAELTALDGAAPLREGR
jgi:hypothetical protein